MNIEVGKKVYELRKKQNMTQEELASEMGVSIAAVSKWETGNSIPDVLLLCALADFFHVSTDELLGRTANKKKVIVVDDAEFIRNVLTKIITENGYEVIGEAADGNELLDLLKTKKADVITLDINMPGMDGLTALKHIRKDYPNMKVLICSAVNDKSVLDSVHALNANGWISKPFLPEDVITRLRRMDL